MFECLCVDVRVILYVYVCICAWIYKDLGVALSAGPADDKNCAFQDYVAVIAMKMGCYRTFESVIYSKLLLYFQK